MSAAAGTVALEVADWRRHVGELYAAVRAEPDPAVGHGLWRERRELLFRTHPQSPLPADDPLRETGLPHWPYDPELRAAVPLLDAPAQRREVDTGGTDGVVRERLAGRVELPGVGEVVDVWWLEQYGGGLFLPLRDSTAGQTTYGGGRYLLDTAKGADLGAYDGGLVIDLNFLYHPSCRYSPDWTCPLAGPGSTIAAAVEAGERLPV